MARKGATGKGSSGGGGQKGSSGRGARDRMFTRVKSARGRKLSSTLWLKRQLNDPYVHAAQRDGYRSRAAYKLIEIDDRFKFLRRGKRVLDLGAAPGGWLQVAAARVGEAHVFGIDLTEIDPMGAVTLMQLDFMEDEAPAHLRAMVGGDVDIVLSDMAAAVTGHRQTDHLRTLALVEAAAWFAIEVLTPNGTFCAKVFQGGTEASLLSMLKQHFRTVAHVKPQASRKESSELYVVAQGFKGR